MLSIVSGDPAAADNNVAIIEDDGLPRSDRALLNIKGHEYFVPGSFDGRVRCFMAMADLRLHPHWVPKLRNRDPVQLARAQRLRHQLISAAHHDLALSAIDLQNVKRIARRDAKSFALPHGEVVYAVMLADDVAIRRDQLARGVRQGLARLFQISIDELGVIAAGDEADLLRVGFSAIMSPSSRAFARTSDFLMLPIGNSVRLSCSCVRPKRK